MDGVKSGHLVPYAWSGIRPQLSVRIVDELPTYTIDVTDDVVEDVTATVRKQVLDVLLRRRDV